MPELVPEHPSADRTRAAAAPWSELAEPEQVASAARIYDYLLGGSHNFAVDRRLAKQLLQIEPDAMRMAQDNRAFMGRAVRWLAGQGIRQFLDLGSGVPTVGNVHEIAQEVDPQARVVYVDIDPIAVAAGQAAVVGNANAAAVQADIRDPHLLANPIVRALIDVDQPVGVLAVAVMHFLLDDDDPQAVLARFRDMVAPGSFLVVSHVTGEHRPQTMADVSRLAARAGTPSAPRTRAQIAALFAGWDPVPPGVTWTALWRPDHGEDIADPAGGIVLAGVAGKPRAEPGINGRDGCVDDHRSGAATVAGETSHESPTGSRGQGAR